MEGAISNFYKLTGFPLENYFLEVENFFKFSYPEIAFYFMGKTNGVAQKHVKALDSLIKKANNLSNQFRNNRQKMKTVDYWELSVFCDDIRTKLETSANLAKYLRSSRTDYNYDNSFNFPYLQGNQQTMENISGVILQDLSPENDWAKIMIKNDLQEKDWDIDGGENLQLFKERFVGGFVQSVIDVMIGEKIYGLDIDRKFTFINDDLKILSYKETVFQCVDILSTLKRGQIPEFPTLGINSQLTIGGNIASLSNSAIVRELKRNFETDDLFMDFKVSNITHSNGDITIEYSVKTKYELLIKRTAVI